MRVLPSDLTPYARARNAALEGFARDGVASTSIRDVAKAAGVSPGLVQHHFPTKAALIQAVNDYVIEIATDAFSKPPASSSPTNVQQELGDRVTAFMREHPTALLYVARSTADGDEAVLGIFDAFLRIAQAQWQTLADHDLLRVDADLTWAALHVVVLNLGTILLTEAINRHLPASFFSDEQLERWNAASNALFREGMYRSPSAQQATD
ncbi:MAG TPA: TetR/AcrR family transcriptional regulator [Solirubrobacteraceae bacterium]|jgi:AcrR family transcriptional regulator